MNNIRRLYSDYLNLGGDIDYQTYKEVLISFNTYIMDKIMEGYIFNMKNLLSSVCIIRIDRNFEKPTVNWPKSNKRKKQILDGGGKLYDKNTGEGEKWIVYYVDDYYLRFYWNKFKCRIKNKSIYTFKPTRGKYGNVEKLVEKMNSDDLHYTSFLHSSEIKELLQTKHNQK